MYVDLDAKDRELLDILKRDARTPVTVLAEVLSLSRNTVQKTNRQVSKFGGDRRFYYSC